MSTVRLAKVQRLVLHGVSWQAYGRWLRLREFHRNLRLTYDRGILEVMTITYIHENWARFLDRLVVALTEELGLPIAGGGATTFRWRKKKKGLEPDECYWIRNEHLVRSKERINLDLDPPPDLVIEVDISRSSRRRMAIYAALGVPEVWRYNATALSFHELGPDGKYAVTTNSNVFPALRAAELMPFLNLRGQLEENGLILQFRTWIRQHLSAKGGPTP